MAEQVSKYDAERQGSLTGVVEGLASEDDAAVLGVQVDNYLEEKPD